MGNDICTRKITSFHALELINGLAFLRFPLKRYGYVIDDGIILIFEDERKAYQIKNSLLKYSDAEEIESLKKGHAPRLNFTTGIHIHRKSDKDEDI